MLTHSITHKERNPYLTSIILIFTPARASAFAAMRPAGPAPTISTSTWEVLPAVEIILRNEWVLFRWHVEHTVFLPVRFWRYPQDAHLRSQDHQVAMPSDSNAIHNAPFTYELIT